MVKRYVVLLSMYVSGVGAVLAFFFTGCGFKLSDSFIAPPTRQMGNVECTVRRTECAGWEEDQNSTFDHVNCFGEQIEQVEFVATACYDPDASNGAQAACNRYCEQFWAMRDLAGGNITCTSTPGIATNPAPGICNSIDNTGGATARITCKRGGRQCDSFDTTAQGELFCSSMPIDDDGEDASGCFDPSRQLGEDFCENNFMWKDGSAMQFGWVNVSSVQTNSAQCQQSTSGALVAYGVAAGSVGTLQAPGQSVPLSAKGGFIAIRRSCDSTGEFCNSTLSGLRIALQDATVSGLTIRDPEVRLVSPVPLTVQGGHLAIAAGSMTLEVFGGATGLGRGRILISPASTLTVNTTSSTISITGTFSAVAGIDPPPALMPITISMAVSGSTGAPGAACAGLTPLQMLLGFESLTEWVSTDVSLTVDGTRRTQGCFGVAVGGSNFRSLRSAPFATPLAGTSSALKLDFFIPPAQPNPHWLGAVQMHTSCPSANVFNAYIGQVELTGKPSGQFSTLTFPLPSAILGLLSGVHPDCFFTVSVNTNATPTQPVLDNLRFN